MGKLFGYHTLGVLLKSLSDSCFRADEQEKRGGEGNCLRNEQR